MHSDKPNLYTEYITWKRWDQPAVIEVDAEKFSIEISRAALPKGGRILDVGFGRGDFLDWGREHGFSVSGIEINPTLVSAVRNRGHSAFLGLLTDFASSFKDSFDCIVMFDVLEHLSVEEILSYLKASYDILRPAGALIARSPNGASIAGLVHQYGDITHTTPLSVARFQQLAAMTSFRVEYSGNAARSHAGGRSPGRTLQKSVAYATRGLFEIFFGYLYFGRRIPLDPDVTVVLRRD